MKMKRFLSLVLAMVMSLALAAPAFAAEDGDPNEGIMPLAQLYSDNNINANSDTYKPTFTTTPGAGKYLRVWFRNKGAESVVVTLWDYNTRERLMSKTFIPNDPNDTFLYTISAPDKACSFYLTFQSIGDSNARVIGQAAAAQHATRPSN